MREDSLDGKVRSRPFRVCLDAHALELGEW